jgi:hypothetical protein
MSEPATGTSTSIEGTVTAAGSSIVDETAAGVTSPPETTTEVAGSGETVPTNVEAASDPVALPEAAETVPAAAPMSVACVLVEL